jgi:hypothetical protein
MFKISTQDVFLDSAIPQFDPTRGLKPNVSVDLSDAE